MKKEGLDKRIICVNKKSQITVFIIIGILLVVAIAAYLTLNVSLNGNNANNMNYGETRPIYNFVQDCIEETGEDAIYQIGKTGGYVIAPEPRMHFDEKSDDGVAFYLHDSGKKFSNQNALTPSVPSAAPYEEVVFEKENLMPTKEIIEKQLSLYMDSFLYYCVGDFSDFSDFNITQGKIKTTSKIEKNKVVFNVNYPLTISKESRTYVFNEFSGEVFVRLNQTYSLIQELMDEQMKKPDAICMSCIYDLSTKYDLKVKMMDAEGGIIFVVLDEKSKINNHDYLFYFANKYN